MSLQSINCSEKRMFRDEEIKNLTLGWNCRACPNGDREAEVIVLAEGITPRGIGCRFCRKSCLLAYTVGGVYPHSGDVLVST